MKKTQLLLSKRWTLTKYKMHSSQIEIIMISSNNPNLTVLPKNKL